MLLEETATNGLPVTIDARAIETIEPQEEQTITFVGLSSGRVLWVRSHHEAFRDRWRAALAAPAPGPVTGPDVDLASIVDTGWRAGMAEAARMVRAAATAETARHTQRVLSALEREMDARAGR